MTWEHGAISVDKLSGDGGFSFILMRSATGVVVGLSTEGAEYDPAEMEFAVMARQHQWCVVSRGRQVTPWKDFTAEADHRFYLMRIGDRFKLWVSNGDTGVTSQVEPEFERQIVSDDLYLNAAFTEPWQAVYEARLEEEIPRLFGNSVYGAVPSFVVRSGIKKNWVKGNTPKFASQIRDGRNGVRGETPLLVMRVTSSDIAFEPKTNKVAGQAPAFLSRSRPWNKVHTSVPRFSSHIGLANNSVAGETPRYRSRGFAGSIPTDPYGSITVPPVTSVIPREALALNVPNVSADGFYLSAGLSGIPHAPMRDVLWFYDSPDGAPPIFDELADTLYLGDQPEGGSYPVSADTLYLADAPQGAIPVHGIVDALYLADSPQAPPSILESADTLYLYDAPAGAPVAGCEDGLALSDEPVYVPLPDALTDILYVADETTSWAIQQVEELIDTLTLGDATWAPDLSVAESVDALLLADVLSSVVLPAEATAVVLSPATRALHTWKGWPFTHMAQAVDGTILAVGPMGLCVVGADTDDGAPITSRVHFGALEFGGYDQGGNPKASPRRHHVQNLWVSLANAGRMHVRMGVLGQPQRYTYVTQQAPNQGETNQRAEPGRGLVGRYWDIEISNCTGADFEVVEVSADVVESNRRI